jgi:hypothetical protein
MTIQKDGARGASRFPRQKISYKKKIANKKEWFKECIDAAETMALNNYHNDHRKMNVLYDLDNDIIDEREMEKVFNPMGLEESSFPSLTKNYPISTPKIDLLQGEELKRRFDWSVRAKNLDVESSEQTALSDLMMQMLVEEIQSKSFNEQDFEKRFNKFAKYAKYNWKSKNETTATRILQYLWREQNLQEKFNSAYRDALVGSKEIFRVDIEGDEPIVDKCDPRTIFPIRQGNSHRIEDSDIVVQVTYEPINKVIDSFYDYLEDSAIDEIEELYASSTGKGSSSVLKYEHELEPIYSNLDFGNGPGFVDINNFNDNYGSELLPFDDEGNVRVVRARWVGRKRIAILTYFDPNTGDELEKVVSEFYKPNEELGETMRYIWINEAYEGTKIANDKYVKMQRRDVQMRHFDNHSKCFLGYVGTDYGKSLMERMEPYQYLYNIYMRRLELIMAKYKGPIYELDISKIPDDWEMDKWMYYADTLGWAVIDNFNEAKKGAATGKLAGQFNTGGRVLDPNVGNYIQQVIMMLQHIEDIMGKIAGVNDQRLGQVDNRETVGGVERAVTQSSHITEKWFFVHDETKKRVMAALLDTAKYAWRNSKSKKLNFVLDDMSRVFLDFNPQDIASSEYDLFITNSSRDMEIRQSLKQLSHAMAQNGQSAGMLIDVMMTESITEMARKIEAAEDEVRTREEQMQQSQQEMQQQIAQAQQAEQQADRKLEYDKLANDKYKAELDANTKLQIAGMNAEDTEEPEDDSDKVALEERKHDEKMNIERGKLSEVIRSNKAKETIARLKPKTTSK